MRYFSLIMLLMAWGVPQSSWAKKKDESTSSSVRSRIVHFSQSGINLVKVGIAKDQVSSCVIVLSNPSAVEQLVYFRPNAKAEGTKNGDAACNLESGLASPLMHPGAVLPPKSAPLVIRCTFPAFPAKKTGQQMIYCGGTIETTDSSTSPGYLEASGSIEVFVETERGYQNLDKDGKIISEGVGTYPVFNSVPIVINGGKSF